MGAGAVTLGCLLAALACGGRLAEDDPLASIPIDIDPALVEPAPLRTEWTVPALVEDEETRVPDHRPALDDRAVYVVYGERMRALAVKDGRLLWELHADAPITAAPVPYAGGVAFPAGDAWMFADADGRIVGAVAAPGSPDAALFSGGVLVALTEGELLAIRPPDGATEAAIVWQRATAAAAAIAAGPAGRTLVATGAGTGVAAYSLTDGSARWERPDVPSAGVAAAIGTERAFVPGSDTRVRALALADGRTRWTSKQNGVSVRGAPVLLDDLVWVPGLDGGVHGYDRGGGSQWFRVALSGRAYLDLVAWGRWVIASPQYGPWTTVRGPLQRLGPSDPGLTRVITIPSSADLEVAPAVGSPGVATIDAQGRVRLLRPPPWARGPQVTAEPGG